MLPIGRPTKRPDPADQRRQHEAELARRHQAAAEERERKHARRAAEAEQRVATRDAKLVTARVRTEAELLERNARADMRGAIAAGDVEAAMAAATRAGAARLVITSAPSD